MSCWVGLQIAVLRVLQGNCALRELKPVFASPLPHMPAENEIVYLDSRELAMRLRLRFETGAKRAGQEDPHAVLEVRLDFACLCLLLQQLMLVLASPSGASQLPAFCQTLCLPSKQTV